MHYVNIEDRVYKLTNKQYKHFMKLVDETFDTNPVKWSNSLQWVEDNAKFMFKVDSFCY